MVYHIVKAQIYYPYMFDNGNCDHARICGIYVDKDLAEFAVEKLKARYAANPIEFIRFYLVQKERIEDSYDFGSDYSCDWESLVRDMDVAFSIVSYDEGSHDSVYFG